MGKDCCGGDRGEAGNGPPIAAPAAAPAESEKVPSHKEVVDEKLPYYQSRIDAFEKFKAREDAKYEAMKGENAPIKIVLPDGNAKPGIKGVTTPLDVALSISKGLAKNCVVARVDKKDWDLTRPLEGDCALELFKFDDAEGKYTFWHSTAHLLGLALELEFGGDLTIGPPVDEGFYYDCYLGKRNLADSDKKVLEKRMESAVKAAHRFERIEVSRDEALTMFQENKFKLEIINGLAADAVISVYRVGPMVDLCTGPHVQNSGVLKALAVTQCSRSFWRADVTKDHLQRVYGVSYPDNKLLKDYQHRMEEAKKRDHRNLGLQHELFFFHHLSPGSCFFLPHGARIYNALVDYIRAKYWEYEYDEVVSPNIYNFELWNTSGHAQHYAENMFSFDIEKAKFGLKPMNCPGHCLMFAKSTRSYRELPLRFADFGVLHRNEYSGALHGLTRVRRFQQDDAHIFCRPDQVMREVSSFLRMLGEVYTVFGLEYEMALSTRPEGYLGEIELWNEAEAALEEALNASGRSWKLDPGEGAFYGPKIDITVFDALRRKFQCATVQLDFQLPIRFNLEYMTEEGMERPVIVHRAILGSVERMFAILTEHFAGKWPLWLSPRQVMVVPISEASREYALSIRRRIRARGLHIDVDDSDRKMQKKVREAQLAQYNYILVVGEKEKEEDTVNVRTRDNVVHGMHKVDDLVSVLKQECSERSLTSLFGRHGDEQGTAADAAANGKEN